MRMVAVLESHLSLLEREAESPLSTSVAERASVIEDLIAMHLAVFEGTRSFRVSTLHLATIGESGPTVDALTGLTLPNYSTTTYSSAD